MIFVNDKIIQNEKVFVLKFAQNIPRLIFEIDERFTLQQNTMIQTV